MPSSNPPKFHDELIAGDSSLVIIDVGTHKAEEISTLYAPLPRQLFLVIELACKNLIRRCIRRKIPDTHVLPPLKTLVKTLLSRRQFKGHLICIEPNWAVGGPEISRLSRKMTTTFFPVAIAGHDQSADVAFMRLFKNEKSLSSSLYQKSTSTEFSLVPCLAVEQVFDALLQCEIITNKSRVVLRLNCEGAELSVLRACAQRMDAINVIGILGSIGDLGKIHGVSADAEAISLISDLEAEYTYFKGDVPRTWSSIFAVS